MTGQFVKDARDTFTFTLAQMNVAGIGNDESELMGQES